MTPAEREHRRSRERWFGRFGLSPDLDDEPAVRAADAEVRRIIAERSALVAQGWTWIDGYKPPDGRGTSWR